MHYPLVLYSCEKCGLAQVLDYNLDIFNNEYPYQSSIGQSYVEQCRRWVQSLPKSWREKSVLEIACNDGYLLKELKEAGFTDLAGVEPVKYLAEKASQYASVCPLFFDTEFVNEISDASDGGYHLIIANNVLAHVPDLNGFIAGMKKCLAPDGIISVEIHDFQKLLDGNQFDTIYHEHYSYFDLTCLIHIFSVHGLGLRSWEKIPSHGGSLRVQFTHAEGVYQDEDELVGHAEGIENFSEDAIAMKRQALSFITNMHYLNQPPALFGAAAKGATFLNYVGVKKDIVKYCIDETPSKIGKFMPGSGIPIVGIEALKSEEHVLVLPWNFIESICAKIKAINPKINVYHRGLRGIQKYA